MAEKKLYCGFCLYVDTYETKKSIGAKKHANISSTIKCNKCGRNLNQKNVAK